MKRSHLRQAVEIIRNASPDNLLLWEVERTGVLLEALDQLDEARNKLQERQLEVFGLDVFEATRSEEARVGDSIFRIRQLVEGCLND